MPQSAHGGKQGGGGGPTILSVDSSCYRSEVRCIAAHGRPSAHEANIHVLWLRGTRASILHAR